MDFQHSFLPVFIKYDFISENHQPTTSHEWIECRLNVKSSPNSNKNVQINVYPKLYDELLPYFTVDIDYSKLRNGPLKSRSKENVYGILWSYEQKMCRIFIAFDDKAIHHNFSKYFRKLLKISKLFNNCENECKGPTENIKSSVCNEPNEMTSSVNAGSSSVRIMRVSDASGNFEDVVLRPKNGQNRRLARPFAVISGLFKSNRESANVNQEENAKNLPNFSAYDEKSDQQHKLKKKTWNIFKTKRRNCRRESVSFQHFQEPLNVERLSLPTGGIDNDLEWYDLNKAEMSFFEARMSVVLNEFNKCTQMNGESGSETTISSNILWSHNLPVPCQSTDNACGVNQLGGKESNDEIFKSNTCEIKPKWSLSSTDSNGYVVVQTIRSKENTEPIIPIDAITDSVDVQRGLNLGESSRLSSGFESDSDECTPKKSIAFISSPPTSDFSDAYCSDKSNECSPIALLTENKNMQKTSKKRSFRIKSRKLLGMLPVKPSMSTPPTSSPSQLQSQMDTNVMPTPQNKSPLECMKKVYKKGTPFKIRLSKQAHQTDILNPLESLEIESNY